jgi:hypothetical protein
MYKEQIIIKIDISNFKHIKLLNNINEREFINIERIEWSIIRPFIEDEIAI